VLDLDQIGRNAPFDVLCSQNGQQTVIAAICMEKLIEVLFSNKLHYRGFNAVYTPIQIEETSTTC
jgi:hypothetical protein